MSSYRDNNFTEKQIRGLNLTFDATKKKYKFLKKWDFSPTFKKYVNHLYLDITIDMFELADFLDLEIADFYKEHKNYMTGTSLSVFFRKKDDDNPSSGYFDREIFELSYKLRMEIESYFNNMYSFLPDDHKIFAVLDSSYEPFMSLVSIRMDTFTDINI
jgi:hypothetical protein